MLWFTADLHATHPNILGFCTRRFRDIYDMQEEFIEKWNKHVEPKDTVYILGDVFFDRRNKYYGPLKKEFLSKLHGDKYLVPGNHDKKPTHELFAEKNRLLLPIHYLDTKEVRGYFKGGITLCHYAMLTWPKSHWNNPDSISCIQLFGHSHDNLQDHSPYQMDIGVDSAYRILGEYRPFSLVEIWEILNVRS